MLKQVTLRQLASSARTWAIIAAVLCNIICLSVLIMGHFDYDTLRMIAIGTDVWVGLAFVVMVYLVMNWVMVVVKQVERANDVMRLAAGGDFTARVTRINRNDEIGSLLHSTNRVLDLVEMYAKETGAAMLLAGQGKYVRHIPLDGLMGDYREFARRINEILMVMAGNAAETNKFEADIRALVDVVASATEGIHKTSVVMTDRSKVAGGRTLEASEAAVAASERVESVSLSTSELAQSVNEIAQQVAKSAEVSRQAVQEVEGTAARMNALSDAVAEIGNIVSLIQEIASQTNLLALNATIEAARAGEAGKGFAVVANEVKALANQTARATGDISRHIGEVQQAAQGTTDSISTIVETIERINDVAAAIAGAVQEQEAVTRNIADNIQGVVSDTENVSDNIADLAAASAESSAGTVRVFWSARKLSGVVNALHSRVSEYVNKVM